MDTIEPLTIKCSLASGDITEFLEFDPIFMTRVARGFSGFAKDQHAIVRGATQRARSTQP